MKPRSSWAQRVVGAVVLGMMASVVGCSDPEIPAPEALDGPVKMTAVSGEVCLPDVWRESGTIGTSPLASCDQGGQGFALVANQRSANVGVLALGQPRPRWANLDARRPGITRIPVGARPVGIATGGDQTAAVVASESERTLTGIDLWTLRPLEERSELEGTPRGVEPLHRADGQWSVAALTVAPNRIEVHGALSCERPDNGIDRRDHVPDENCAWRDEDPQFVELPGRPVDMAVDQMGTTAWVVYRDRNEISEVRFTPFDGDEGEGENGDNGNNGEGNGDDGEGDGEVTGCLEQGHTPPCEVARLSWEGDPNAEGDARWGANAVAADPLGLFVYAMDRPNNRLYVFDQQRRTLINAAESMEPPATPYRNEAGIPLVRSAMAMNADVRRQVIEVEDPAVVNYQLGVRIAANNGRIYRVGAVELDCRLQTGDLLDEEAFFFDPQRRVESEESRCFVSPEFPLGGHPDVDTDDELRERRFIDVDESTQVAVTPVFGLRDAAPQQGRLSPLRECEIPDAMFEQQDGEDLACNSPSMAQPLGLDVDEEQASFADSPRADLLQFAWAYFDENGDQVIERGPYDPRLVQETWEVTYEGVLPGAGQSAQGLVAREGEGRFRSGGSDYCATGVEVGDRLTILSAPADRQECAVFSNEDASYRSWEITDVGPFHVQLAVIDDDDFADVLPTRNCFDRGLNYRIRPVDEWTVVGESSGMQSPWERDGEEACVLRDGAESGAFVGRIKTGEEYIGPYLRFRLYAGAFEPAQGLRYRFGVERNFSLDALVSTPENSASLPRQLVMTPNLGAGRYLVMVDAGGDRLYLRNQSDPSIQARFIR